MQNFSKAYIRALAASLQFGVSEMESDFDSVDLTVSARGYVTCNGKRGKKRSPQLGMQLKCTAADQPAHDGLRHVIPRKNYDDLRSPENNLRRILVVVSCPRDWSTRLTWSPESIVARHAAYWASLEGAQPIDTQTKTIHLPQLLSPDAFTRLMFHVAEETPFA